MGVNGHVWSVPVETSASEMRMQRGADPERTAFYYDVCLRLEQTKPGRAVMYEFPDKATAILYVKYVRYLAAKALGSGTVCSSIRPGVDGKWQLYFSRGPQWGRDGKSSSK